MADIETLAVIGILVEKGYIVHDALTSKLNYSLELPELPESEINQELRELKKKYVQLFSATNASRYSLFRLNPGSEYVVIAERLETLLQFADETDLVQYYFASIAPDVRNN